MKGSSVAVMINPQAFYGSSGVMAPGLGSWCSSNVMSYQNVLMPGLQQAYGDAIRAREAERQQQVEAAREPPTRTLSDEPAERGWLGDRLRGLDLG